MTPSGSLGVGSALRQWRNSEPLIDAQPPPPIKGGMEDSPPTVSSSVMERDMQTEKLMRERASCVKHCGDRLRWRCAQRVCLG